MRRRSLLIPALCAAAAAGPAAAAVRLAVPVAHAARLQIPGDAGSVIVGDPAVADALVINHHTIYVEGRANGLTEIVVLDRAGQPVWQGEVAVITPDEGRVTVVRGPLGTNGGSGMTAGSTGGAGATGGGAGGAQVTDMTCADVCTPVVKPPAPK